MKNKTKDELLEIIQSDADDKTKHKARAYLWHMMERWSDEELHQCEKTGTEAEREIAKWHLWRRHLDTSKDNLLDIIHNSTNEDYVREAAIIIGDKDYKEAVDDLIELLRKTKSCCIKEGAAYGLRALGNPKAFPFIVEQLKKYPECSESFVYALEVFDCREILELLVAIFMAEPKALLLRINIRDCIKNQDLENVPEAIRSNCLLKLDIEMQGTNEQENLGQLEDLYVLLRNSSCDE